MGRLVWRGNYEYIHQCSQFPASSLPQFFIIEYLVSFPAPGDVFFCFLLCSVSREYWMICIEDQAFSTAYDFGSPPPPAPSPLRKLDRRHTGRLRKRDNLPVDEGMCHHVGIGEDPSHTMESLVLYTSFNTLWVAHLSSSFQSPVHSWTFSSLKKIER